MPVYRWLSPPEPGALALLRLDAPPPCEDLPAPGRARLVRLLGGDGAAVDEAVLADLGAGAWELSCHGGPGMRAGVEAALHAAGFRPGELPLDAAWEALAACPHPAGVAWLLGHPQAPPPFPAQFLKRPPRILIAGPVNAGKSSLLNAFCGIRRSLVSAAAGTTRDLVSAELVHAGWRLAFWDSAGERDGGDELERAGQDLARQARELADLRLWLDLPGMAGAAAEDLRVAACSDRHAPADRGLPWSIHGLPGQDAGALRALLLDAILARLGLPAGQGSMRTHP